MLKKCQSRKSFNMLLFVVFLLLSTFLLHKYSSFLTKEGMDNYESTKPRINVLYDDDSGIEISELGQFGRCLIIEDEIQLCEKQEHIYHEMIVHLPVMYIKKPLEYVVIVVYPCKQVFIWIIRKIFSSNKKSSLRHNNIYANCFH